MREQKKNQVYREESQAGRKEFFLALGWAALLYFVTEWFRLYVFAKISALSVVFTVLAYGILAFFVLTRYSAVYSYTIDKESFRATRRIGKRDKQIEIRPGAVREIVKDRPSANTVGRIRSMCPQVFPNRKTCYVIYSAKNSVDAVRLAVSPDMQKRLKKFQKSIDKPEKG